MKTKRRTKVPPCYRCGEKKARRLKGLPGAYGKELAYCSVRCAAMLSLERHLCGALAWCQRHQEWEDDEMQRECAEHENENPCEPAFDLGQPQG